MKTLSSIQGNQTAQPKVKIKINQEPVQVAEEEILEITPETVMEEVEVMEMEGYEEGEQMEDVLLDHEELMEEETMEETDGDVEEKPPVSKTPEASKPVIKKKEVKRLTELPVYKPEGKKTATKDDILNLLKNNIQFNFNEATGNLEGLAEISKKDTDVIYQAVVKTMEEILFDHKLNLLLFKHYNEVEDKNTEFKLNVKEEKDRIYINPKNIAAREGILKKKSYKVSLSYNFDGGERISGYLPEGVELKDADHIVLEDGTKVYKEV